MPGGGGSFRRPTPKVGRWTRDSLSQAAPSEAGRTGCTVTCADPDSVANTPDGQVAWGGEQLCHKAAGGATRPPPQRGPGGTVQLE